MSPGTGEPSLGVLLEGGGSRTWAALSDGTRILATATGPSTNPRSVGDHQAEQCLTALLGQVTVGQEPAAIAYLTAAHGAASTTHTAHSYAELLRRACQRAHLDRTTIRLTNDITPVLLADPSSTVCAIIAGTGTGFAARQGRVFARASGLEWLLSDEGGAHNLATAGLRAAVRACDGRGPETVLTGIAHAWSGHPDLPLTDALFDTVYAPHAKAMVATFAVAVLHAADTDPVAASLVEHATQELVIGAQAACLQADLRPGTARTIILSGSLLTATTVLAHPLVAAVRANMDVATVRLHDGDSDHPAAMLHLNRTWETKPDVLLDVAKAIPTVTRSPRQPDGTLLEPARVQ